MRRSSLTTWLSRLTRRGQHAVQHLFYQDVRLHRPPLSVLVHEPEQLPLFVQESAVAMRYLTFLAPLAWDQFPERDLERNWGMSAVPYAPVVAAWLIKVEKQFRSMSSLRRYLVEHPALVWVLGFPLQPSDAYPWGFDVDASLPTHRHLNRMLRTLSNESLQVLLGSTVSRLQEVLSSQSHFGRTISLDTKHIIAWVKENHPKAFIENGTRYDKEQQPAGDPDCRLGCKKRRNQHTAGQEPPATPLENSVPASSGKVGEWYWGYGTGVVATKVPGWGEFVLAELSQTFDKSDVSYFFPLMNATTQRLGFHPTFGAFDAAFAAFYVYEDFHTEDGEGFAAVPRVERGPTPSRSFTAEGLPLCEAGLAMPLKGTFWAKTSLIPHEKGRYACPLQYPTPTGTSCPLTHKNWEKGGCVSTMPTSIGARLRHQLDRHSAAYKAVSKQRTATERVNSQAGALGIERPKIRNGHAIANQNTLISIIINLRALQRIHKKKTALKQSQSLPST